jgi:hypothetical protein
MKREELKKRLLKALFDSKEQLLMDKWMKQTPIGLINKKETIDLRDDAWK